MLFNSIEFAIFLPITFGIYWVLANRRLSSSNLFLLGASYLFYGFWDYRFLVLIIFSSAVDFHLGKAMGKTDNRDIRKRLLITSLVVNLGILGIFKYYGFFVSEFMDLLGLERGGTFHTLQIVLPVGISFYTFQTLSYTIDIYRRRIKPCSDWLSFFAFVAFFPQLVAGPIERASNLLPQFQRIRSFDYEKAKDGARQILWGLFKKVVIADSAAIFVEDIFGQASHFGTGGLLLGLVLFSVQIYCDFSGYSDIAIGTARLFGFDLMKNFAFPYFSRDIGEFWRRWHISLSTWFRDYLYIPLGGSQVRRELLVRNIFVVFLISGLWHGANWTFIIWGLLHAVYFLPAILTGRNRRYLTGSVPAGRDVFRIMITFSFVCLAWTFFRAENVQAAWHYLIQMFTEYSLDYRIYRKALVLMVGIVILFVIEWIQRDKEHAFQMDALRFPRAFRAAVYLSTALAIVLCAPAEKSAFIYFQF